MFRTRSLPMLATVLAVLVFVAWMNIGAGPDTSLFEHPPVQGNSAHAG